MFKVTNILVVVVRYYGGTKLSVGGLINAYRTAAKEALGKAEIVKKFISEYYSLAYDYADTGDIMNNLAIQKVKIIKQDFENNRPLIEFSVHKSKSEKMKNAFEKYNDITLTLIKTI